MAEEGTILVGSSTSAFFHFYVVRVVAGKKVAVGIKPECVEAIYTQNRMMFRKWQVSGITGEKGAFPLSFDEELDRWVLVDRDRKVKCREHVSGATYITITLT